MSKIPYTLFIGSIIYVMLCTRLDILYALSIYSRNQFDLSEKHYMTIKNILKCLRRIKDYMLTYGGDELILVGYMDSDFIQIRIPRNQPLSMCLYLAAELSAGEV